MIFNTFWFIVFSAVVIPVFWLLRKPSLRLPFLAIACAVFHWHFAGPAGVLPIIALGTITYFVALTRKPLACALGITLSVLALVFYKYTHFLSVEVLGLIKPAWGAATDAAAQKVLPHDAQGVAVWPLGMSFFAFEFVHYLIEVRRGGEPIRSPLRFVLFAIFFPSLVAGPIKRYGQYQVALQRGAESVGVDDVALGIRRVAMGFLKKVVIADNLTLAINFYAPQVDPVSHFAALTLFARWCVFLMMAARILMDFSGYSDIAIGLARMLGIELPENFNWPYAARSIQDFWQRWHMSLTSWIRDYIYIPLGGNRRGPVRRVINGMIAFALVGLWHGSAWNFVIWGLYHGVGLAICATYGSVPFAGPLAKKFFQSHPVVSWGSTQLFAWLGWLVFFYPVHDAIAMGNLLFTAQP